MAFRFALWSVLHSTSVIQLGGGVRFVLNEWEEKRRGEGRGRGGVKVKETEKNQMKVNEENSKSPFRQFSLVQAKSKNRNKFNAQGLEENSDLGVSLSQSLDSLIAILFVSVS